MIHSDIIDKYAPDAGIGKVGSGVAVAAGMAPKAGGGDPASQDKGSTPGNHQAWGHPRFNRQVNINDNPGVPLVSLKAYLRDTRFLVLAMLCEVFATTISSGTNVKISIDRPGPTRNAIQPILVIVIHVVGNFGDFKGPGDFSGDDFLYVRPYWTGFCLPANIVEEHTFRSVPLHIFVSLKRPGDMKLALVGSEDISVLNRVLSGLMFLTFMAIHLFHLLQFRSGGAGQFGPYYVKPTPYLVNLWGISSLNLFRTNEDGMERVGVGKTFHMGYVFAVFIAMVCASLPVYTHLFVMPLCPPPYLLNLDIPIRLNLVRSIHRMELGAVQSPDWCLYYLAAVIICSSHMRLSPQKVVPAPALEIPQKHHDKAIRYVFVAMVCASFLVYTHLFAMPLCPPQHLLNLDIPIRLNFFGMITPGCAEVAVRDIYRMKFEIFQFPDWRLYYLAAVPICSSHLCLGCRYLHRLHQLPGRHPPLRHVPMPAALPAQPGHLAALSAEPHQGGRPALREGGGAGHFTHGVREVIFVNDVEYLPVRTPLNRASAINHPANIQPDRHTPGAPLSASAPALKISKKRHGTAIHLDYVFAVFIATVYASFLVYTHLIFVGLERMRDMKLAPVGSHGVRVLLNLGISGLMSRSVAGAGGWHYIKPTPYLINFWGISTLNLFFWANENGIQPVGVRDIYVLEFQTFKNPLWSFFYTFSVCIFVYHVCIRWKKVTQLLDIPRRRENHRLHHHDRHGLSLYLLPLVRHDHVQVSTWNCIAKLPKRSLGLRAQPTAAHLQLGFFAVLWYNPPAVWRLIKAACGLTKAYPVAWRLTKAARD